MTRRDHIFQLLICCTCMDSLQDPSSPHSVHPFCFDLKTHVMSIHLHGPRLKCYRAQNPGQSFQLLVFVNTWPCRPFPYYHRSMILCNHQNRQKSTIRCEHRETVCVCVRQIVWPCLSFSSYINHRKVGKVKSCPKNIKKNHDMLLSHFYSGVIHVQRLVAAF